MKHPTLKTNIARAIQILLCASLIGCGEKPDTVDPTTDSAAGSDQPVEAFDAGPFFDFEEAKAEALRAKRKIILYTGRRFVEEHDPMEMFGRVLEGNPRLRALAAECISCLQFLDPGPDSTTLSDRDFIEAVRQELEVPERKVIESYDIKTFYPHLIILDSNAEPITPPLQTNGNGGYLALDPNQKFPDLESYLDSVSPALPAPETEPEG